MKATQHVWPQRLLILAWPLLWGCDSTEPTLVGSVAINAVNPHLTVGETVQLAATVVSTTGSVMSGHPVTWSSTQESVASVSAAGRVTALAGGTTTIRATSEGKSGSLTLTVASGPCTASMTSGSLGVGQAVAGTLGPTTCMLGHSRAQGWSFQLTSATGFRIVMTSAAFSPDLVLTDLQLNPVLWPDWHPDGAQLVGQLPAGQYIVWATSWSHDPSGSYHLTATAVQFCSAADATTIATEATVSGTIGTSACVFMHGDGAVGYRLDLPQATGLQIDLSSHDFDAVLVVTDEHMNVLFWDDDGGAGTDARIVRRFPPGASIIWAISFGGSTGTYQLSVAEVEIPLCPTVGELEVGAAASGTLAATDCLLEELWYVDPWHLSVSATTTLVIDLTSTEFDTFLILEDEHGGVIAMDDDGGVGLNSRLEYTFEPGQYRVVATSYFAGATGAYTLTPRAIVGSGAAAVTRSGADQPWLKASRRPGRGNPR